MPPPPPPKKAASGTPKAAKAEGAPKVERAGVVPKAKETKRTDGKSSSESMEVSANMAFPKSDGDGHKDVADPDLIRRVLEEPDASNMNIAVVVRIRPPNQRELDGGAKNIVIHADSRTKIRLDAPSGGGKPQFFEYDYAIEAEAEQHDVFSRIGVSIVQNSFHGFNTTMFAYGQTSSGKSFSMIGKLAEDASAGLSDMAGIIPRVSHLLFSASHATPATHEFFIEASFIEIYNEKVRDLLDPGTTELKVRESPKMGVHITGLTKKHVQSSYGVGNVLNMGFQNRTVAATKYNSESSRSHAIFELNIRQKFLDKHSGEKMGRTSKINLVDLAGSERSDKIGSTGTQLKEGNNINKSLTVLGRCIKDLVAISKLPPEAKAKSARGPDSIKEKKAAKLEAEKSGGGGGGGGKAQIVVPFRESVLTWYLRESLSGNSRTTMLATVSPVALNYEESASTLRYAASAKNIKTAAAKNEDPMEAKVRTLSEEIAKLKAMLEAASSGGRVRGELGDMDEDERMELMSSLQSEMAMAGGAGFRSQRAGRNSTEFGGVGATFPQLSCLNKDQMLSHAMKVPITPEVPGTPFTIGRDTGGRENDFVLNGVGIHPKHCEIEDRGDEGCFITNPAGGAVVLINGQSLEEIGLPAKLNHLDRVTLGPCRLLALYLTEPLAQEEKEKWTYEAAFAELMHRESLQWTLLSPKRRRLLDKLKEAEILYVEQANAIAIDMCTCVRFHATIILGDGVPLLRKAESTVDEVLEAGDCEVVIVCSVNPAHIVETREDQIKAVAIEDEIKKRLAERSAAEAAHNAAEEGPHRTMASKADSMMLSKQLTHDDDDDDLLELHSPHSGGGADMEDLLDQAVGGQAGASRRGSGGGKPRKMSLKEELERMGNLTLFEMKMDQFEELLAELKVTYSYVASLSQGLGEESGGRLKEGGAEEAGEDSDEAQGHNTVQAIFDTVDCDGSGTIDRAELAAAFKLFDETAIDPDFCEHMMDELLPSAMAELDFDSFASFLVKFLQHQYYHKLEPFVSNQRLFVTLGGRDLTDQLLEERKKEQALELRNAELEHEIALLKKKKKKKSKKGGAAEEEGEDADEVAEAAAAVEQDLEAEGLDADGEQGVLKFMAAAGLEPFGPTLVAMGVDNISDLLDPDLVGDDELAEAGMSPDQVETFREAVARRKEKAAALAGAVARGAGLGLAGSVYEDFDPTIVGLEALTEVPVIIMNARSKRKLFAQAGKRPTIFETWNKGFGAGPEEHTFKDNKWWLVPQRESGTYVIVNAHSSRKLYAKHLRPGAMWEKDVGAVSAEDSAPENSWNILPEADGTYTLQNASSLRKLYARIQKAGDAWTNTLGAAPNDAASTDTKWYLIPDPSSAKASAIANPATAPKAEGDKKKKKKKAKEGAL